MTISVSEVCNDLQNNPRPLIFLDTCTILDIVNSIHLNSLAENYIEQAAKLISLTKDNKIQIITALNVKEEYNDNIDNVVSTAEKQIKQIERHAKAMCNLYFIAMSTRVRTY